MADSAGGLLQTHVQPQASLVYLFCVGAGVRAVELGPVGQVPDVVGNDLIPGLGRSRRATGEAHRRLAGAPP